MASGAVLSPGRWAERLERVPGQKWKGTQCVLEVGPRHTDGSAQLPLKAGAVTRATTGVRHGDVAPECARQFILTEEPFLQRDGGLGRF